MTGRIPLADRPESAGVHDCRATSGEALNPPRKKRAARDKTENGEASWTRTP